MIRLCYVTTVSLSINAFLRDVAEYLYQTGEFEITFICDNDDSFAASLPDYFHYHPIIMSRGISLNGLAATKQMITYFKKEKFDIVQFSSPNASFYASIASKVANIPVRIYCQWGIAYVGFKGIKREIFKVIEKIICRNATIIEPDSRGNKRFSVEEKLYSQSKARVIGNGSASGVNLTKFDITKKPIYRKQIQEKLSISENNLVYGFVGRLDKDKGVDELLLAYRKVMNDQTILLMVGPKDKYLTLDQELYQWSLKESSIIYTGGVPNVEQYLSAMDIFILPSYREGFGSSVIEAEAMGLPVIVTNIPGPTEAMKDQLTGVVIPKADVMALAQVMSELSADRKKQKFLGENAHKFVEQCFEQRELFQKIYEDRIALIKSAYIRMKQG